MPLGLALAFAFTAVGGPQAPHSLRGPAGASAPIAVVAPGAKGGSKASKPATKDAAKPSSTSATTQGRRARTPWWKEGTESKRKFMVGLAGVIMQAPPIRTEVIYLDPRDIGRSVAMGGLGVFARWRVRPIFALDLDVRSGSVRYGRSSDVSASQDQFLADLAALLYLGRGDVAQFALSGGIGGMASIVRYEGTDDATGRQTWGSATFRVGAEAEFLFKRLALVLSFRAYGVAAGRSGVANKGEMVERAGNPLAPVAPFTTMLVGSAGIAYRF